MKKSSVLLAVLALGCTSYANWQSFQRTPGYRAPAELDLVVARSDEVRARDQAEFVETAVLTVMDDLRKEDVIGHIVEASGKPPTPPYVGLSFVYWTPGDRAVQSWGRLLPGPVGMAAQVAGAARLVVEVEAHLPDGKVALSGRITGEETAYNANLRGAAEAAGHSIAKALTDAKYDPSPPKDIGSDPP